MTHKDDKKTDIDLKKKLQEAAKAAQKKEDQEQQNNTNLENSETEKLKAELSQMTELAKRTMADLQNLRRRQEEEKFVWIKMANIDLLRALLPILDNFERSKQHIPKEGDEFYKGLEMSINQFQQVIQNAGVKAIESVEKPFNPDFHEAISQGPGEKDIIIEEFEKGYMLSGRVIRHAKVRVGNGQTRSAGT